jgi:hypothetical protein
MRKAEIISKLHEIADFNLLGAGSWPGNREFLNVFSKARKDMRLEENFPGLPGTTRDTTLGREINLELFMIFAGAWCLYEVPEILKENGYLNDSEEDEIFASSTEIEAERLIHRYVLRAYLRFSNYSRLIN